MSKPKILLASIFSAIIIWATPALSSYIDVGHEITYTLEDEDRVAAGVVPGYGGLFHLTDEDTHYTWDSFCIELDEYIFANGNIVDSISTQAVDGGLGGGSPDPISPQTGWLYSAFLENPDYYTPQALQIAFWYLEQEIDNSKSNFYDKDWWDEAMIYVADANKAAENSTSLSGTRVVNLVGLDKKNRQSFLAPVPIPPAALLLASGLVAFVGIWRRVKT